MIKQVALKPGVWYYLAFLVCFLLAGDVLGQIDNTADGARDNLKEGQVLVHRSGSEIRYSLNFQDKNIVEAISHLAAKSGIDVSFRSEALREEKITLELYEVPFYEALYAVLHDFDTSLELSENGRVLVIHGLAKEEPKNNPEVQGSGTFRGRVIDRASGEELIGANVVLENTAIGAATNERGEFQLPRIPAGEQVFVVRYLGYVTTRITVTIVPNEQVSQDIFLDTDTVEGEEVIIYTQALGQAMAIRQQIRSNTIVNVVSEARLRELPDANAAESLGRLPGVSLIRDAGEGQRVAIRGLSPRYNTITFDGARVPSTDEDGRAVDLNMISSEMLSGIEVYKAITPDMDADAIGGSVNFSFAPVPEGPRTRLNLRSGYSSHINNIGSYNASLNASNRFYNNMFGVGFSADYQQHDRSSDVFTGSYEVLRDAREDEEFAPMAVTNIGLRDRVEIRDRYGLGLMMDMRLNNGTVRFNNFASRLDRNTFDVRRRYNAEDRRQDWDMNDRETTTDVLSSRLAGNHRFGMLEIDWMLSRNISVQEVGYGYNMQFREFSAFDNTLDTRGDPMDVPASARNNFKETRFHVSDFETGRNSERDISAELDLQYTAYFGRLLSGRFKTGGKYVQKDRSREADRWRIRDWDDRIIIDNDDRDWQVSSLGRLNIENLLDYGYSRSNFLDGRFTLEPGIDRSLMRDLWEKNANAHRQSIGIRFGDQDLVERLAAAYVMGEINVGTRLMILPGVRFEHENSDFTAKRGTITGNYDDTGVIMDTTANRVKSLWFPMVHVRMHLTNWLDVRVARTETIARPNFSELLPYERIGSGDDPFLRRGNPFLEPARSTNYDVMLTAHGNRVGLFALGLFYKTVNDLIYQRAVRALSPEDYGIPDYMRGWELFEPFNNPYETTVRGFEVEWQSNLTWLPVLLNGLVVNANYSRIWSETQYPVFYMMRTAQGLVGVDTFRVAPMIHQPNHVGNVSLGYDYRGFSGRISVLYQGQTLRLIRERMESDSFTDDYIRWDAQLRQRVMRNFDVILNLHNLTNRRDGTTQFKGPFPTNREYYGWAFDIGVRYSFF